jgi:hypothetical protein
MEPQPRSNGIFCQMKPFEKLTCDWRASDRGAQRRWMNSTDVARMKPRGRAMERR